MSPIKSLFAAITLCLFLGACAGTDLNDYSTATPKLVLEEYFDGQTIAYGVFEDRFGKLRREFKVVIDGSVDSDGTLILDEDFFYKDGERAKRIWRIKRQPDGSYEGRADDIIGVAIGRAAGNVLNWRYKLDLRVGEDEDDTWRVSFDDWMYLQDDNVLINRAFVSRFGIEIGSVTITFVK